MLRAFTVTCVAVALITSGCSSKPTPESLIKDTIAKMKEMVEIMKGVKDEASAKAAQPKMLALKKEMEALKTEADKMAKPSAEEEKRLQEKYEPELTKVTGELMGEAMRIGLDEKLAPHLKDAFPS